MDNKPPFFVDLDAASAFAQKAMLAHMVMQAMKHYEVYDLPYLKIFEDGSGGIRKDRYDHSVGHVVSDVLLQMERDNNDALTKYLSSIGLKTRLKNFLEKNIAGIEKEWPEWAMDDARWGLRRAYVDVMEWLEGEMDNG
jgi:hypothetical protein